MPLVTSLLTAIVRADGDALVLHAGERPYVVAPSGQTELASRSLTLDAMKGMLKELLPADAHQTLAEIGAVQHGLASPNFATKEKFTVIAARGGDDIWIEIRRHRAPVPPPAPAIVVTPIADVTAAASVASTPHVAAIEPIAPVVPLAPIEPEPPEAPVAPEASVPATFAPSASDAAVDEPAVTLDQESEEEVVIELTADAAAEIEIELQPAPPLAEEPALELVPPPEPEYTQEQVLELEVDEKRQPQAELELEPEPEPAPEPEPELELEPELEPEPAAYEISLDGLEANEPEVVEPAAAEGASDEHQQPVLEAAATIQPPPVVETPPAAQPIASVAAPPPVDETPDEPPPAAELQAEVAAAPPVQPKRKTGPVEVVSVAPPPPASPVEPEFRPAVVLPLTRTHHRDQSPRFSPPIDSSGIDRLLRIAAGRGASALYVMSQARPSLRVEGEIVPLDGEAVLTEPDVEALILDMTPDRNREVLRSRTGTEWICDVPDLGRIGCVTFRDHRGAGAIFRMVSARAIAAEQLGMSREIQSLCAESDGLVLVAGPRASGKSMLIATFVDLINRTRSDHVITIENNIEFVHENRGSLVSQREVRGDRDELLAVARAAIRENPDVLVIEDFGSPEIVALALDAAQAGHLVIGALSAHTATDAVERIIDQTPPQRRQHVQLALAENLRGIVTQVLLRKPGGGRVAAREVLLNTRAVANVIAEGKTSQLPMAIDSGRKHGMVSLNDALVAYVQSGIVDSREAYRRAADQQGFLALLKRQGIDTSFVERLA